MANRVVGGIVTLKVNGETVAARGAFTVNTGQNKREMVAGADRVHGAKEMIQVPFIDGNTSDLQEVDLEKIKNIQDATVTLSVNNGKQYVLRRAHYCGEGDHNTEEGEVQLRFEGEVMDDI